MDLSEEDVTQILKIVDEAGFGELEIEWKGLSLRIVKGGSAGVAAAGREQARQDPKPAPSAAAMRGGEKPAGNRPAAVESAAADAPGMMKVAAPVMGTFYRRPEPGAAPFVEEGGRVKKDDTLCLLEVMKVFTAVKAEVPGRIEKILAEDAQLVDFGQLLFLVRPD